ncbi:MAG: RDD family protein [Pseudomonadota bacterium]
MYYYNDGEQEVGPFSFERLAQLKAGSFIGPGTLVREGISGTWVPYATIATKMPTPPSLEERNIDHEHSDKPLGDSKGATHRDPMASSTGSSSTSQTRLMEKPIEGRSQRLDQLNANPLANTDSTPIHDDSTNPSSTEFSSNGWTAAPPRPWRRYGARFLDITFNGLVGLLLIGILFYAFAPQTADRFFGIFESGPGLVLDLILTGFVASLISGALIGMTGFTLGKWIFGIRITRIDKSRIGFRSGIARDLEVWMKGVGFGIPVFALFTMIASYQRLKDEGQSDWDRGRYIAWSRPHSKFQVFLNIIGIVLIIVFWAITQGLSRM